MTLVEKGEGKKIKIIKKERAHVSGLREGVGEGSEWPWGRDLWTRGGDGAERLTRRRRKRSTEIPTESLLCGSDTDVGRYVAYIMSRVRNKTNVFRTTHGLQ